MIFKIGLMHSGRPRTRRQHEVVRALGWLYVVAWCMAVWWLVLRFRNYHPVVAAVLLVGCGLLAPAAPSLLWSYERYKKWWDEDDVKRRGIVKEQNQRR